MADQTRVIRGPWEVVESFEAVFPIEDREVREASFFTAMERLREDERRAARMARTVVLGQGVPDRGDT